jgi:hypothetical protein
MGRIITLSMAVLMTIGRTGVVLSETVKQTAWGGTTKAAIMQVPGGETTATDPRVTGFDPLLSGPTMGNLMPGFDPLSDTMMGDPNYPNSFIPSYDVASQNGLSPSPDITTNPFAADLLQPTVLDQSQLNVRVAR